MGGGGAIQDMINSVRNNRSLLRKTTIFDGPKHNYVYAKALYEKKKRLYNFKEATPQQLKHIREEIRREQKGKSLKVILVSLLMVFLLCSGVSYGIKEYKVQRERDLIKKEMAVQKLRQQQFILFSNKADYLLRKGELNKAAYTYRLALIQRPHYYETELKLARTLYFICLYHGKDCFNALDLTNELLQAHPENPKLQKMKAHFEKGF